MFCNYLVIQIPTLLLGFREPPASFCTKQGVVAGLSQSRGRKGSLVGYEG